MMMGTCHYISPEQARGLPADERSDIYGAGVVLFEMLTGRVPFAADSDVAVALKHVDEAPPRPRALEPAIPEAVERVVLRALEKDPGRRFQTAAEFAAALDAAMSAPAPPTDAAAAAKAAVSPGAASVPPAAAPPATVSGTTGFVAPPPPAGSPPTLVATGAPAPTAVLEGSTGATEVRPPRRRRVWRWLAASALFLTAAAVTLALLYVFVIDAGAVVPKLVGRTEAQARTLLSDADLRVEVRRIYVDGVDAGSVARQRPSAGTDVDDGTRVDLWVSKGPLHVEIPSLRGLSAADAEARLLDAGLAAERRNGRSDDVAEGEVYAQEPTAGERATRGDTVTFWVSSGLPRAVVPDVVGLSSQEAASELEAAGFTAGVDIVWGWGEYPDTVVEQDPVAGTKAEAGTEVTISVAVF
jgi:serine/threonine-protein kinase